MLVDALVIARDSQATIGTVVGALARHKIRAVTVIDRHSRDATPAVARDHGAIVVRAPARGYGAACRVGQDYLSALPRPPDVVLIIPGDAVADAEAAPRLLAPIVELGAELAVAVGARQRLGSRAATRLIDTVFRHNFAGIGASRAIKFPALVALGMSDRGDGWDIEMLVRALRLGLTCVEVPIEGSRPGAAPPGRSLFHVLRHATVR